MLDPRNNIDNAFQKGLGNLEVEPSASVWGGIEAHLNAKRKGRSIIVAWSMITAASVLVAVMSIWIFLKPNSENLALSSVVEVQKTIPSADVVTESNLLSTNKAQEVLPSVAMVSESESLIGNKAQEVGYEPTQTVLAGANESWTFDHNKTKNVTIHKQKENRNVLLTSISGKGFEHLGEDIEVNEFQLKGIGKKEYLPLYASNENEVKPKKGFRMLVGGAVSSAYNYRETSGAPVQAYSPYSYSESGINSIGGGINVRIEGNSRWSVETGVIYAQMGQEISSSFNQRSDLLYADVFIKPNVGHAQEFSNSLGQISFSSNKSNLPEGRLEYEAMSSVDNNSLVTDADGIRQTLDYIEVPLLARYKILDGFPVISLAGGFSSNFLVGNTAYLLDGNKKIEVGQTDGVNPVSWSSSLGIGVEVPISKLVRINLEPRVKYYLESVSSNPEYNFQPYSFSVFGGLTFIIK